jgi:hypothetical protein
MKKLCKTGIILIPIMIVLFVAGISSYSSACEACNRLFLAQLQGSERSGTLVSQELLATIAAQESIGRNNPAGNYPIAPGSAPVPSATVSTGLNAATMSNQVVYDDGR